MLTGNVRAAHLAHFNSSSFFFLITLLFIACVLNITLGHYTIIRMYVFEKLKCRSHGVKSERSEGEDI